MSTMTETREARKTLAEVPYDDSADGDDNDGLHYVPKASITASIVTDCLVTALCGTKFRVGDYSGGIVSAFEDGQGICAVCAAIYESLPAK